PKTAGVAWCGMRSATGFPALEITMRSPAWTRSSSRDRCVFASWSAGQGLSVHSGPVTGLGDQAGDHLAQARGIPAAAAVRLRAGHPALGDADPAALDVEHAPA